jgi:ABC-type multidrug transport system fused ATPase/permease subunit
MAPTHRGITLEAEETTEDGGPALVGEDDVAGRHVRGALVNRAVLVRVLAGVDVSHILAVVVVAMVVMMVAAVVVVAVVVAVVVVVGVVVLYCIVFILSIAWPSGCSRCTMNLSRSRRKRRRGCKGRRRA